MEPLLSPYWTRTRGFQRRPEVSFRQNFIVPQEVPGQPGAFPADPSAGWPRYPQSSAWPLHPGGLTATSTAAVPIAMVERRLGGASAVPGPSSTLQNTPAPSPSAEGVSTPPTTPPRKLLGVQLLPTPWAEPLRSRLGWQGGSPVRSAPGVQVQGFWVSPS